MGRPGTCEIPRPPRAKPDGGNRHRKPLAAKRARCLAERMGEHEIASNTRSPRANP